MPVSSRKGADVRTPPTTARPGRGPVWLPGIWPWIATVLRIVVGVVWIIAGIAKVGDPAGSVRAVRAYQVLPEFLVKGLGYGLPYLEIALGVLLIVGLATRLVAIISALLFVVYIVGIAQAAARGLQIDCGCFGGGGALKAGQTTTYTWDLIRDVLLLIGSGLLAWWPLSKYSADDWILNSVSDPVTTRVGPRRTKEAQRRLAALQEQRRKESARRLQITSVGVLVALVAVFGIGLGVQSHRAFVAGPAVTPTIASDSGILVGKASAKTTVDMYEDFICPVCGAFEKQTGAKINSMINDGTAKFRYHPLGFLDPNSSPPGYSSRAANAAACMPTPTIFKNYHDLLYANQPQEGSPGLSNSQLIALGKKAGDTSPSLATCVNGGKYNKWVAGITDAASKANVTGTPTVRINGKAISTPGQAFPNPADLQAAVTKASQ
jgi:protein-disulfide isomerase